MHIWSKEWLLSKDYIAINKLLSGVYYVYWERLFELGILAAMRESLSKEDVITWQNKCTTTSFLNLKKKKTTTKDASMLSFL